MTRFKHIYLLLAPVMMTCSVILSMSGCRVLRPAQERIVHDTLKVENTVVIRDTVLKSSTALVTDTFKIPCPDVNISIEKQSGHAHLSVKIQNGKGTAECFCDSAAIRAQLKNYYEKKYHSRSENKTITVKEEYVPDWIKFFAWSGGVYWLVAILTLGIYFKKIIS